MGATTDPRSAHQPITVHGTSDEGSNWAFETPHWRDPDGRCPLRRCSYCNSLHPLDLADARAVGMIARIDRSVDQKYGWPHKIYVDLVNPDPDRDCVVSAITFEPSGDKDRWIPVGEKERRDLERDGWGGEGKLYVQYAKRPTLHAKYYTGHGVEPWITEAGRRAIGFMVGYIFERADDGSLRWRAFDYSTGGPS